MTNDIIFFTGDEYADYILTKLIYWLEDHENIYLNEFEKGVYVKFYDEANLEKFVELVFDAYPLAVDTPNIDYDIEWCWNEFLHSSAGRYAKAWLENYSPIIESAYFLDDLDKPTIAETMDFIERPMEEFFTKNPIGKKCQFRTAVYSVLFNFAGRSSCTNLKLNDSCLKSPGSRSRC